LVPLLNLGQEERTPLPNHAGKIARTLRNRVRRLGIREDPETVARLGAKGSVTGGRRLTPQELRSTGILAFTVAQGLTCT
jgi:hypothetical protein